MGSLVYTDSLSKGLEKTVNSANAAVLTIQEAAYGFSENMKALQGNFFLRGYFKRKAAEEAKKPIVHEVVAKKESGDSELDESELKAIIAEAQKALDAKNDKK